MYTEDEVQALREAVDNARDRCMLELFLNTGQRIRAIQTLRVKDVDPEDGTTGSYYLNTDAEGLKGAAQNGSKRPLLGANGPSTIGRTTTPRATTLIRITVVFYRRLE